MTQKNKTCAARSSALERLARAPAHRRRLQSDIATRVTQQLGAAVLAPERRMLEMRPTDNLEAYKEHSRGDFLCFHNSGRPNRFSSLCREGS